MPIRNELYSQTNELKPMKKLNPVISLSAFLLLGSAIMIGGCKKEEAVKPVTNQTITQLPLATKNTIQITHTDNFFIGYLGNEPVKFEGSAVSYSAYVDPDSAHMPNGHGPDNDSYYLSGSKWVTMTGTGMSLTPTVNASVEMRSLAVRVFVSPITPVSTIYYNLLSPMAYPFADGDDSNTGAFVLTSL